MQRLAVIAKLKPQAVEEAETLIAAGPPFDLKSSGFERHTVYLCGDQAIFVFEGGQPQKILSAIAGDLKGVTAFARWEPLLDGLPKIAKEVFSWQRADEGGSQGGWGE
jgi:hypothetical protein